MNAALKKIKSRPAYVGLFYIYACSAWLMTTQATLWSKSPLTPTATKYFLHLLIMLSAILLFKDTLSDVPLFVFGATPVILLNFWFVAAFDPLGDFESLVYFLLNIFAFACLVRTIISTRKPAQRAIYFVLFVLALAAQGLNLLAMMPLVAIFLMWRGGRLDRPWARVAAITIAGANLMLIAGIVLRQSASPSIQEFHVFALAYHQIILIPIAAYLLWFTGASAGVTGDFFSPRKLQTLLYGSMAMAGISFYGGLVGLESGAWPMFVALGEYFALFLVMPQKQRRELPVAREDSPASELDFSFWLLLGGQHIERGRKALPDLVDNLELLDDDEIASVIIPCYNGEAYLRETLDSLLAQEYTAWEAIVIDDCSTDQSAMIVDDYAKGDKRFKLLRHELNRGLSASRNTGITAAKGRYVVFLDADDLLMPRAIIDRVKVLQNNPHATGAYDTHISSLDPQFQQGSITKKGSRNVLTGLSVGPNCPFPVHCVLLYKEALDYFGLFNENMFDGAEDWELWQRMLRGGAIFLPTGKVACVYRQQEGSMVHDGPAKHFWAAKKVVENSVMNISETAIPTFYFGMSNQESRILFNRAFIQAAMASCIGQAEEAKKIISTIEPTLFALFDENVFQKLVYQAVSRMACKPWSKRDEAVAEYRDNLLGFWDVLEEYLGPHAWVIQTAGYRLFGRPKKKGFIVQPLWKYGITQESEKPTDHARKA